MRRPHAYDRNPVVHTLQADSRIGNVMPTEWKELIKMVGAAVVIAALVVIFSILFISLGTPEPKNRTHPVQVVPSSGRE